MNVTSPSKSNIEEANKHLQALYSRVHDLERTVHDQNETLSKKDELFHMRLKELETRKDSDISRLQTKLQHSEQKVQNLIAITQNKDKHIVKLQEKSIQLDELMKYTPLLESFVSLMSSSPRQGSFSDVTTHHDDVLWKRQPTAPIFLPKLGQPGDQPRTRGRTIENGEEDQSDSDDFAMTKEAYL